MGTILYVVGPLIGVCVIILVLMKLYYRSYTSRYHILYFRNGVLHHQNRGGRYFLIPLLDDIIVMDAGLIRADFTMKEQIVFFKDQEIGNIKAIEMEGFFSMQIIDPLKFYQNSISEGSESNILGSKLVTATSNMLCDLVTTELRRQLTNTTIKTAYQQPEKIEEELTEKLKLQEESLGLNISNLKISRVIFNLLYEATAI